LFTLNDVPSKSIEKYILRDLISKYIVSQDLVSRSLFQGMLIDKLGPK